MNETDDFDLDPPPRRRSYTEVLCGLDFSDESSHALRFAGDLCHRVGARLLLVHVFSPLAYLGGAGHGTASRSGLGGHRAMLGEEIEALRRAHVDPAVSCKQVLLSGSAHEDIPKYAKEHKVDLIVLGRQGHGSLENLLLGSVSERILRLASCAVIIVPPPPATQGRK